MIESLDINQIITKAANRFVGEPICVIVLGMGGSGKTTFVGKLAQLAYDQFKPYVINLDPACVQPPYGCNINIHDTVDEITEQYNFETKGLVETAVNLFAIQIEKVLKFIKNAGQRGHRWCIIDAPGPAEEFVCSTAGTIITKSLACMFPTIVVYIMDIVRSVNPVTFVTHMLQVMTILRKTRLPFIVALNKIDVLDHSTPLNWMKDFEALDEATLHHSITGLPHLVSRTADTFYKTLSRCAISSITGVGFDDFFHCAAEGVKEYEICFKVEYNDLHFRLKFEEEINIAADQLLERIRPVEITLNLSIKEIPTGAVRTDGCMKCDRNASSKDDKGEDKPTPDSIFDTKFDE
ncbi:GPN-loop GTPase 1-like [Teleopsis dalmanni]|uniref:GPN-loop GTPase 1-like n=1 Tax=Teleopsis dalmanni TaxID=139649 RepID=UPI0018CFB0E5|nr:GPN-loop GTPase 1-like [Teleopsis dalmanni]